MLAYQDGPVDPVVVAELNALVDERLVQLVWASTWGGAANRLLAPAVGLLGAPYDVAEVGTHHGDFISHGIWVKTLAVGRWLRESGCDGQPIIMVDDLFTERAPGIMSGQRLSIDDVGGGQNLFLATDPRCGLRRDRLSEIRAFAERMASA